MLDEIIKGLKEAERLTEEAIARVQEVAKRNSERAAEPAIEDASLKSLSDDRAERIYGELVDDGLVDERALRTPVEIEIDAVAEEKVEDILDRVGYGDTPEKSVEE